MPNSLLILHVDIAVLPDDLAAFLDASLAIATASREEPGVVRYDVLTDRTDPTHVIFIEIYRDAAAAASHLTTAHFLTWRDTVAPMMARPRQVSRFMNTSPDDAGW